MGQTSSQLVPPQVPEPLETYDSQVDDTPFNTPPTSPKKRAAPLSDNEAPVRRTKKSRTNEQESRKEHRTRRAVPQHRRGFTIKPQGDVAVGQQPGTGKKSTLKHGRSRLNSVGPPDESLQLNKATRDRTRDDEVVKTKRARHSQVQQANGAQPVSAERTKSDREDKVASDVVSQPMAKEDAVVNTVGNPGPKRKKKLRKKSMQAGKEQPETECIPDSQLQHSENLVPTSSADIDQPPTRASVDQTSLIDGTFINPIGRPGPRRKQKKLKVADHSSSSDDVIMAQKRTVAVPRETHPSVPVKKREQSDNPTVGDAKSLGGSRGSGLSTDETGKLNHTKAKKKTVVQFGAQNELIPKMQSQPSAVGSDGLTVNPVGNPGPKRKKRKQKHAEAGAQRIETEDLRPQYLATPGLPGYNADTHADDINASELRQVQEAGVSGAKVPFADNIPTPPDSPDDENDVQAGDIAEKGNGVQFDKSLEHANGYDPTVRPGYVDPTDQITGWLNSQEFPPPPDNPPPGRTSPDQAQPKRKRKRASQHLPDDSDEYQDDQDSESIKIPAPKPRERGEGDPRVNLLEDGKDTGPQAMRRYHTADRGTVKGPLSAAEKILADKVFNDYCQSHNLSTHDLRAKTVDWTNAGSFKTDMYEAFPNRALDTLRKFCQRRYTPCEKGEWTADQDKALKAAIAAHPDQWAVISNQVGRTSASCRDRYRNTVQYENTMERGAWSTEEEAKLIKIVNECMVKIMQHCNHSDVGNDPAKIEKLINWKTVAESMGGTRSAKRCCEKWPKIKRRLDTAEQDTTVFATTVLAGADETKLSRIQKAVEMAYSKLGPGDILDNLDEFCPVMSAERDKQYHDESTFWSVVATKLPNSVFPSKVRRRAYYGALQNYDCKSVRKQTGIVRKGFALAKRMRVLDSKGQLKLNRNHTLHLTSKRTESSPDADEQAETTVPPNTESETTLLRPRASNASRKKYLSEAIVHSDDEDEVEAGAEEQFHEDGVEVPETQDEVVSNADDIDDVAANNLVEEMEVVDDLPLSSLNSRYEESLWSGSPKIHPADFVARCKVVGRKQHRAYSGRR